MGQAGRGTMALAASLSRLRGPAGALPVLGRDRSRGEGPALQTLAWGMMGAGCLGLLGIGAGLWLRARRRRRVDPGAPRA